MHLTALDALLKPPPDPPRPPPAPKPAGGAFQRMLAEQRAAARNAEPAPPRAAPEPRPARSAHAANRPAGEREARAAVATERQPASPPSMPGAVFDTAWRGGGGRENGGSGGQGGAAGAGTAQLVAAGELDLDLLLGLWPPVADSGIFELLLPGGERLGVVADIARRQAGFLLTPSTERLRQQLNKAKVELEKGLEQRMNRHVRLTVL